MINGNGICFEHVFTGGQAIDRLLQVAVADDKRRTVALPSLDELADGDITIGVACTLVTNVIGLLTANVVGSPAFDVSYFEVGVDEYILSSINGIIVCCSGEKRSELLLVDGCRQSGDSSIDLVGSSVGIVVESFGIFCVYAFVFSLHDLVVELQANFIGHALHIVCGSKAPDDVLTFGEVVHDVAHDFLTFSGLFLRISSTKVGTSVYGVGSLDGVAAVDSDDVEFGGTAKVTVNPAVGHDTVDSVLRCEVAVSAVAAQVLDVEGTVFSLGQLNGKHTHAGVHIRTAAAKSDSCVPEINLSHALVGHGSGDDVSAPVVTGAEVLVSAYVVEEIDATVFGGDPIRGVRGLDIHRRIHSPCTCTHKHCTCKCNERE